MKCYLCDTDNVPEVMVGESKAYKCKNCQLLFVPDFGNEKQHHINYFESKRLSDEKMNSLRQQQYKIDAKHLSSIVVEGDVLDIGCSRGHFINELVNYGTYKNLTGLDIDASAIKFANENKTNDTASFLELELTNFETTEKFDAIFFRGTFQYMGSKLQEVCLKLKKLIKENGHIIIYSLPNADSFIFYLLKEKWNLYNPIEHKLHFNEFALKFMCEKYGFEILELSFPYYSTPYANIEQDNKNVIEIIRNNKTDSTPFLGNIFQVVLKLK